MRTVTRRRRPYMILDAVEFLQLGQSAHPAVQAVLVKQQARLVKLKIPPIVNLLPLLLFPLERLV